MTDFKVGLGQDSHCFGETTLKKPLILGGVLIPNHQGGLEANTEGDVILHAIFNACSTAIGGRSIGFYDPQLLKKSRGKSSYFCRFVLQEIEKKGYKVNNISVMVEAKTPRLEPYALKMKKNLSKLFRLKQNDIGLAFTTGEGLTVFGKGEGIQAQALVSLVKK